MSYTYDRRSDELPLDVEDAQRLLQILKKETGGKLLSRKKIVGYIKDYIAFIPQDIRQKYTVEELYSFLVECWKYGTFEKW
jgi:hypothetical protein